MSNMSLWDKVSTTNPAHVIPAKVNGQNRKSPKAVFQKEKATEMFGIYGVDWGVEIGSEVYERNEIGGTHLLHYRAVLFFNYEEKKGRMPIAATAKEAYIVKRGQPDERLMVDDEAIKKVRTDALTKGLSELGFNADIFKGWYDQHGYAEHAGELISDSEQDKETEKKVSEAEEYAAWKEKELLIYASLNTIRAIETTYTNHIRKADRVGDKNGIKQFTEAKQARINEIKGENNEQLIPNHYR